MENEQVCACGCGRTFILTEKRGKRKFYNVACKERERHRKRREAYKIASETREPKPARFCATDGCEGTVSGRAVFCNNCLRDHWREYNRVAAERINATITGTCQNPECGAPVTGERKYCCRPCRNRRHHIDNAAKAKLPIRPKAPKMATEIKMDENGRPIYDRETSAGSGVKHLKPAQHKIDRAEMRLRAMELAASEPDYNPRNPAPVMARIMARLEAK